MNLFIHQIFFSYLFFLLQIKHILTTKTKTKTKIDKTTVANNKLTVCSYIGNEKLRKKRRILRQEFQMGSNKLDKLPKEIDTARLKLEKPILIDQPLLPSILTPDLCHNGHKQVLNNNILPTKTYYTTHLINILIIKISLN